VAWPPAGRLHFLIFVGPLSPSLLLSLCSLSLYRMWFGIYLLAFLVLSCRAASFPELDLARALKTCSAGSVSNGTLGCTPCPPGTFAPDGAAACQPCRVGHYALQGASACTQCPEDHFCADPTQLPAKCPKASGAVVQGGDPSSQAFYSLPGSTRCWTQCTASTQEGGAKMIFRPPSLPCVGGFTDLIFQSQWPLTPLNYLTQKSLFTGDVPS